LGKIRQSEAHAGSVVPRWTRGGALSLHLPLPCCNKLGPSHPLLLFFGRGKQESQPRKKVDGKGINGTFACSPCPMSQIFLIDWPSMCPPAATKVRVKPQDVPRTLPPLLLSSSSSCLLLKHSVSVSSLRPSRNRAHESLGYAVFLTSIGSSRGLGSLPRILVGQRILALMCMYTKSQDCVPLAGLNCRHPAGQTV
jgi:hypothetical protein